VNRIEHIRLLADYNQWMNRKVYDAARTLTDAELVADRQAYFTRFARHPAGFAALEPLNAIDTPTNLKKLAFADIRELSVRRAWLDQLIIEWAGSLNESDLDHRLHYHNMGGVANSKPFFSLLVHFFNHQTHHRGQATTLLTQAGVDVGDTDLLALID
jgi:uncharacterized damage-inducible protein DinB